MGRRQRIGRRLRDVSADGHRLPRLQGGVIFGGGLPVNGNEPVLQNRLDLSGGLPRQLFPQEGEEGGGALHLEILLLFHKDPFI